MNGTYHCEIGDFPAVVIDAPDNAAVTVAFAEDRYETVMVPTEALALVFTPDGVERSLESLQYVAELKAARAEAKATDAAAAEQALEAARKALADAEQMHETLTAEAAEAAAAAQAATEAVAG